MTEKNKVCFYVLSGVYYFIMYFLYTKYTLYEYIMMVRKML